MRFVPRITFAVVAPIAIAIASSCGDEGASRHLGFAGDGGSAPIRPGHQASDAESESPMSTMRIAHLAPGLGPIDFCYQPATSGTFVGPVLGGPAPPGGSDAGDDAASPLPVDPDASPLDDAGATSEAPDGGLRSASHRTVSKYLNLQGAGPLKIAVIAAGASSCANALATGDVTLDPGKLSTVVVFGRPGDGGMTFDLGAFTDDRGTEPDKLRVRIIHAALGHESTAGAGALAVRAVGAKTTALADRVEPRRASTPSQAVMVDNLGYVTAPAMSPPVSLAIGPASGGPADAGFEHWQSQPRDLELRGGSLHTGFVLTAAGESSFEVLWCADTTTSGDQTNCEVVR